MEAAYSNLYRNKLLTNYCVFCSAWLVLQMCRQVLNGKKSCHDKYHDSNYDVRY